MLTEVFQSLFCLHNDTVISVQHGNFKGPDDYYGKHSTISEPRTYITSRCEKCGRIKQFFLVGHIPAENFKR